MFYDPVGFILGWILRIFVTDFLYFLESLTVLTAPSAFRLSPGCISLNPNVHIEHSSLACGCSGCGDNDLTFQPTFTLEHEFCLEGISTLWGQKLDLGGNELTLLCIKHRYPCRTYQIHQITVAVKFLRWLIRLNIYNVSFKSDDDNIEKH